MGRQTELVRVSDPRNYPFAILVLSFGGLWLCAKCGTIAQRMQRNLDEEDRKDLNTVAAATLTQLGLIIAFTFSTAVSRYEFGSNHLRVGLIPTEVAERARHLLSQYLQQRVLRYQSRDIHQVRLKWIDTNTAMVENEMWLLTKTSTKDLSGPIAALVLAGMNDVLNSHGYTQAAWANRIPSAAWALMILTAGVCSFLIGYGAHRARMLTLLVLPLAVAHSSLSRTLTARTVVSSECIQTTSPILLLRWMRNELRELRSSERRF